MSLPPRLQSTLDFIAALPGIQDVEIDRFGLEQISIDDLRLAGPFANLPHALIRQSGGGKADQLLVTFSFGVEPTIFGHRSLELLACVVRDWSRSGRTIQLRVDALPVNLRLNEVQTGTLIFRLELIWKLADPDLAPLVEAIGMFGDTVRDEFDTAVKSNPKHFGGPH